MKHLKGILLALLIITLAAGCAPAATLPPPTATQPLPTAAPPSPTVVPATQLPTPDTGPWQAVLETEAETGVRVAAFMNESVGYTGGSAADGRAHYTSDGGKTWGMADTSYG